MRNGGFSLHNGHLLYLRTNGSDSRSHAGNGVFGGTHDSVRNRNCRCADFLDLLRISHPSFAGCSVYILSAFLACYSYYAGCVFLFCPKKSTEHHDTPINGCLTAAFYRKYLKMARKQMLPGHFISGKRLLAIAWSLWIASFKVPSST